MIPKISVITPSFNSGKYIEQAIKSVLDQSYPNFEHIVIDGGSNDQTIEILKKYPHIKWISEPDRGQSDAMNKGLKMSTGEVIVYLNSDDYFEPGAFYTAVEHLNKENGILFVAGEMYYVDEKGNIIEKTYGTKVTLYEMLRWWDTKCPYNPVSYFYFRDVQLAVGGFDEENHLTMDYDFLLKASNYCKIKKIDAVLGCYRWMEGTKTYETNSQEYYKRKYSFSKKYWRYLSFTQRVKIFISFHFTFNAKYEKRFYLKNKVKS